MVRERPWFDSRTGQIGTVSPTARCCDLWSCVAQALSVGDRPATRYTLRRNTASIMKI